MFVGPHVALAVPQPEDFDEISDWYTDADFVRKMDTAAARPLTGEELTVTLIGIPNTTFTFIV